MGWRGHSSPAESYSPPGALPHSPRRGTRLRDGPRVIRSSRASLPARAAESTERICTSPKNLNQPARGWARSAFSGLLPRRRQGAASHKPLRRNILPIVAPRKPPPIGQQVSFGGSVILVPVNVRGINVSRRISRMFDVYRSVPHGGSAAPAHPCGTTENKQTTGGSPVYGRLPRLRQRPSRLLPAAASRRRPPHQ
jgi:hypothetical protein